ncbi:MULTISPECIES: sulfatase family protein [Olivibacter]|jgi:arylsulfatase|uniref:Sulfatase n=1 Tax=Olivibacter oleidegradans TaxID=760123 RepID=A0ABV6HGI4_9SPHI|nr:sulfatase [Olivibacter jilunii]MCL4637578.1 sulfatase [Olivibacter sp. UJ_SKK_5.1]
MMCKKRFLFMLAIFSFQLLFAQRETASQPNIVLIIADDIGWGDIGCYGNKDVRTPNIDALGSAGLVFKNMYLTTSSCSPSRSSIITGRYPHNTGAPELHDPLPARQIMFPEILRKAGYYTALSGKNHMGPAVKKAFDMISSGKGPGAEEDWVSILQNRPENKPFFMWFASHDAHRDWQFDERGITHDPEKLKVPPMLYDGPETRKDLAAYYHEISRLDYYVGKVVEELKHQGILENTYIIFMSDNGSPFPRNKVRLYDSGIKSPFIMIGPGINIAENSSLFSAIDIAPTMLDIAGIATTDKRIQGKSFFGVLQGREQMIRDFVFAEHNWHVFQGYERMVRYKDWVYIRNGFPERQNLAGESTKMFPAGKELWEAYERGLTNAAQEDVFLKPRKPEELYNLSGDTFQFTNVAEVGSNQKILAYLRKVLDEWIVETGDSKPQNPTPDRDDVEGKRLPGAWKKREKPGERNEADTINRSGPILEKDLR